MKRERKMRVFQADMYVVVDYGAKRIRILRRELPAPGAQTAGPTLSTEERTVEGGDALADEVQSFVRAVRERCEPEVSGREGLQAPEMAEKILSSLEIP